MSAKKRICGSKSAVEFTSLEKAREFYATWKKAGDYKMEIIEYKKRTEVPDPIFSDDDPRTILKKIYESEHNYIQTTAMFWFIGNDISELWSRKTLEKHRKVLLNYGADISIEPLRLLEPMPSLDDDEWHVKPKMAIVK